MSAQTKLAQQAITEYLKTGKRLDLPVNLPEEILKTKGGVFVTLYNGKELRGCIGTFLATEDNLAEEIISNAISAATKDNRFKSITKEELPDIIYEVSVLSQLELVMDLQELDPKKYGVIVKSGNKTGLLLPDLEGVDTVMQQIEIASQKAGIDINQEKIEVHKFTTTKYV